METPPTSPKGPPPTSPKGPPPRESLLDRIRGLLAVAEHPNTSTAEAETYTARASALMAKYGIERAILADSDSGTDPIGQRTVVVPAPYARDKRDLLSWVALALGCRAIHSKRWESGRWEISCVLYGFGSDIERAEMLYTSLLVQAAHALAREHDHRGISPSAYRRSWYAGFTAAVSARVREAEERARSEAVRDGQRSSSGRSADLVLADRRSVVNRGYEAEFGHLGRARPRKLSGYGQGDGYRAGQLADIGGTRLGRSPAGGALTQ